MPKNRPRPGEVDPGEGVGGNGRREDGSHHGSDGQDQRVGKERQRGDAADSFHGRNEVVEAEVVRPQRVVAPPISEFGLKDAEIIQMAG